MYKVVVLWIFVSLLSSSALSQGVGDPNRYSSAPGNPACRFFDGFIDNGNGTVTDPRDNLIWKRCLEGAVWNNIQSECEGVSVSENWFDAMTRAKKSRFLGRSNWRLPTLLEFSKIAGNAFTGSNMGDVCSDNSKANDRAVSSMLAGGSRNNIWLTNSDKNNDERAWCENLRYGSRLNISNTYGAGTNRSDLYAMILVSDVSNTSSGQAREFEMESSKVDALRRNQSAAERRAREREEASRPSRQQNNSARGRGGLRELVLLSANAYAARCLTDNSAILTFDRSPLGQYCGESLTDGYKCFSMPSLTAAHICK